MQKELFNFNPPFEGDGHHEKLVGRIISALKPKYIVETGTQYGSTTLAMAKMQHDATVSTDNRLITFEVDPDRYNVARNRIVGQNLLYSQIIPIHTDSVNGLNTVLPIIFDSVKNYNDVVFYLDAHGNSYELPLLLELEAIKKWMKPNTEPFIIVHDCKVPHRPELGFDEYDGVEISIDTMKPHLLDIYHHELTHSYNAISEGANRGVAYIGTKRQFKLINLTY